MIYKATVDGWDSSKFAEKVYDKGSNLIIVKTTKNAICGGYTSLSWTSSNGWKKDDDAFIFNFDTKFIPNNYDKAIATYPGNKHGFCFG